MKHVLLVGDKDPYEKWQGYANEFVRRGWTVTVLFFYRNPTESGTRRLSEQIRSVVVGPDSPASTEPLPELVRFVENDNNYGSLPQFFFNEVFLYDRTYEEVVSEANAMWPVLSSLFSETQFDLVVQNQGAGPLRRLAFAIARSQSIVVLYFDVAWFGDRMFIADNEMNYVSEYTPIEATDVPESVLETVRSFRQERLQERAVYQYQFPAVSRSRLQDRVRTTAKKIVRKNLFRSFGFRIARLQKRVRSIRSNLLFDRFNNQQLTGQPFFFFPLHYPKDSQLALRAQQHLHQEDLVEYIHWCLPHQARLVVKAHPHAQGDYQLSALSRIKKLPRVTLLRSKFSAHRILAHPSCRGTVVLNSSVGFESILHGRPVVALGRFYGLRYPGVILTPALDDLASVLHSLVGSQPEDESVTSALVSIYQATYPGTIYTPAIDHAVVVHSLLAKAHRVTGKAFL